MSVPRLFRARTFKDSKIQPVPLTRVAKGWGHQSLITYQCFNHQREHSPATRYLNPRQHKPCGIDWYAYLSSHKIRFTSTLQSTPWCRPKRVPSIVGHYIRPTSPTTMKMWSGTKIIRLWRLRNSEWDFLVYQASSNRNLAPKICRCADHNRCLL